MDILSDILYPAIEEFNVTLPDNKKVEKSVEADLMGDEGGHLDSIQLVSFIITVEEMLMDVTGEEIALANEKAMSRKNSPFRSVGSLAEYIAELVE